MWTGQGCLPRSAQEASMGRVGSGPQAHTVGSPAPVQPQARPFTAAHARLAPPYLTVHPSTCHRQPPWAPFNSPWAALSAGLGKDRKSIFSCTIKEVGVG